LLAVIEPLLAVTLLVELERPVEAVRSTSGKYAARACATSARDWR
jgi:hypothetical protein